MVKGDAESFTAAAAALTQAVVTVVDGDGTVIASSIKPERARPVVVCEPAGRSRDILLRDESGLWGARLTQCSSSSDGHPMEPPLNTRRDQHSAHCPG